MAGGAWKPHPFNFITHKLLFWLPHPAPGSNLEIRNIAFHFCWGLKLLVLLVQLVARPANILQSCLLPYTTLDQQAIVNYHINTSCSHQPHIVTLTLQASFTLHCHIRVSRLNSVVEAVLWVGVSLLIWPFSVLFGFCLPISDDCIKSSQPFPSHTTYM